MSATTGMADTLLRHTGGRTVLLRLPAPAVPGDPGEQVGLASPQFRDVELFPAVYRRLRAKAATGEAGHGVVYELMLSATAVQRVTGTLAFDSAALLFQQAVGIVVDGALLEVIWMASAEAFGNVYLYRIGLRGALKDVV
jgi:hypothetical protein